jgi:osmotically-inducible protein OsmY
VPGSHRLSRLVLALALPLAVSGCAAAIIGGIAAAGGAGYAANQERGVGGTVDDFTLKTNIQNAWIKENPNMQADFSVTAYQGRVLLTGVAPNPEIKAQAAQIAGSVPGVRTVYNEIEVGPAEGAWDSTKDAWITSRVKSGMVFDGDVRSVNYSIKTVNKSVYLIGSARSQSELDQATNVARNVSGVKRVVSYVEVRPGAPAGTQQAGPPPAAENARVPDAPTAAPTAPVEVQKL